MRHCQDRSPTLPLLAAPAPALHRDAKLLSCLQPSLPHSRVTAAAAPSIPTDSMATPKFLSLVSLDISVNSSTARLTTYFLVPISECSAASNSERIN